MKNSKCFLFPLILILLAMLACRYTPAIPSPTHEPDPSTPSDGIAPGKPSEITASPVMPETDIKSTQQSTSYNWLALDQALENFVPGTLDGLAFLLSKDGKVVFQKALGNQDLKSVLPIASSTKMPSAIVILALVEDGLLELDQPVEAYLQDHIRWPEDKSEITMQMLLNHTSGLVGNPACLGSRSGTSLQACAQEIADAPLEFSPGAQFAYGGGSYQVAGYIAEVVSGKKWNDLYHQKLGSPLGLKQFTYRGGALGSETNPRIAGGASSDVYDYIVILNMLLNNGKHNGKQILSTQTIQMMMSSQIFGLPILRSPGEDDLLLGYSFGFWISDPSTLEATVQS